MKKVHSIAHTEIKEAFLETSLLLTMGFSQKKRNYLNITEHQEFLQFYTNPLYNNRQQVKASVSFKGIHSLLHDHKNTELYKLLR